MRAGRFVVITEEVTPELERKIISSFPPTMGWWHYQPQVWLLVTEYEKYTSEIIRDNIRRIVGDNYQFFVLEVDAKGWSAMMRSDDIAKHQAKWLNETWVGKVPLT